MQRVRLSCSVLFVFLLVVSGLAASPAPANAQTGAAAITGILTDRSGAALPGAIVIALNEATLVTYSTVSNGAGAYNIAPLPVGTYNVSAQLSGFKPVYTRTLPLEGNQISRIDLQLDLGPIDEIMYVYGTKPLMQSEKGTVGTIVSGTNADALPLNGRNTGQLTLLLTGAITPDPASFAAIKNFAGGRPFVNGNREETNNYMLDGVDMNESIDKIGRAHV